jgi:DNA-binding GntR family transcriptional regulator
VLGSRELLQTQRAAMVAALRARDDTRLRDLIVESIEGARAALVESMNSQPAEQTDGFLHPFPQAETKS